jgi:hypothetical protein
MAIRMPHSVKPANPDQKAEAFISGAGVARAPAPSPAAEPEESKAVVNMRFDTALLKRIDAAARRQGISRTAWLHVAASKALE